MNPGPIWSGCARGRAPSVTPTPEGCPRPSRPAPFCSLRPESPAVPGPSTSRRGGTNRASGR
jgi:hypothetical protein